eukprot:1158621-Pelagomonas_calceolata.AAC.3
MRAQYLCASPKKGLLAPCWRPNVVQGCSNKPPHAKVIHARCVPYHVSLMFAVKHPVPRHAVSTTGAIHTVL